MKALWHALALVFVNTQGVLSACPQNDWTRITKHQICAVTGSSVVMACTLTPPAGQTVSKIFWLINAVKGVEPTDIAGNVSVNTSYTGRVEYFWDMNSNKDNCTLKLSDTKMTDSALYRARIIAGNEKWQSCSAIHLSVTNLDVWIPEPVVENKEAKLSCKTICTLDGNPTVIWRKNGADLQDLQTHNSELLLQRVSTEDEGDYSCALKGHEGHPSKPVKLNVMFPPKNTSVSVKSDVTITMGGSLNLTCASDANPPVENYTWFKVNESTPVGSGQQYSITNISSVDGGQYYCEARNKYGAENSTTVSITVTVMVTGRNENPIAVVTVISGVLVCGIAVLLCVLAWIRQHRLNKNRRVQVQEDFLYSNIGFQTSGGQSSAAGPPSAEAAGESGGDALYARVQLSHSSQTAEEAEDEDQYDRIWPTRLKEPPKVEEDEVQYASIRFIKDRPKHCSPEQPVGEHPVIYSSVEARA